MKYASDTKFAGQRLSIGRTVLVCYQLSPGDSGLDLLTVGLCPAVVESIAADDSAEFRLSDGRLANTCQLNGYDIDAQRQPEHGFIATTEESVTRLEVRTWTWGPRV